MAATLHLIAANGTDNLPGSIATEQSALDTLLDAMDSDDTAARLLRGAGLLTLHEKAGYMPSTDPRTLKKAITPDSEHHQENYPLEVVQYLSVIYWSDYIHVYPEWLHYVALYDVPFPYEALPLMLDLASWIPSTQALTKRVSGSRGRWLLEQSGHRGWYKSKHIKPARRPRLTKYSKREARIITALEKLRYHFLSLEVTYELRRMVFPWSERFSEAIARTVKTMLSLRDRLQSDDLTRIADTIQWYIHPAQHETIVRAFRNYNQLEETRRIARKLDDLLLFRAEMHTVFSQLRG